MSRTAVLVDPERAIAIGLAETGLRLTPLSFVDTELARRFIGENPAPAFFVVDLDAGGAFELCRELRHTPRLCDVPLVLVSVPDVASEDLAFDIGASLVHKPIVPEVLRVTLERALDHARIGRWTPRPRVLIVDDDAGIRNALANTVRDEGWVPLCAEDGVDALSLVTSGPPPTMALIDVMLPRMDGVSLATRLRRADGLSAMPVVIISAFDDVEKNACEVGAVAHLKKPFALDELVAVMQGAVINLAAS